NEVVNRSPAVIQSSERLLSVRVGPNAAAPRIVLRIKIPARAHAAIITHGDSIEVKGLPAALLIQTVAGEIRVDLPAHANANVVAESRTGKVSSSLSSVEVNQAVRPQVQARIGNGSNSVRLFSQAGNIALGIQSEDSAESVSLSPD